MSGRADRRLASVPNNRGGRRFGPGVLPERSPAITAAGARPGSRRAVRRPSGLRGGAGAGDVKRSGRQRWPEPGRSGTTGVNLASVPEGCC